MLSRSARRRTTKNTGAGRVFLVQLLFVCFFSGRACVCLGFFFHFLLTIVRDTLRSPNTSYPCDARLSLVQNSHAMGCQESRLKEPARGNVATVAVQADGGDEFRRMSSAGVASSDDVGKLPKVPSGDNICTSVSAAMVNSSADKKVFHICLTGGPCAGKSTFLSLVQTKLPQIAGFKVFCVPEAATLMVSGGLEWSDMTEEKVIEYQLALLRAQVALENTFLQVARASGGKCLIVSDRGTMDGRAFCSDAQFTEILRRGGYTMEQLRDARYDAVIHMVSAAIGAEGFYNFENPARSESVDQARNVDITLRNMYIGHSRVRVFDNSTTFEKKLDRVMDFICEVVGHTKIPHHRTRRFFMRKVPEESAFTVPFVRVRVTATILSNSTADQVKIVMRRRQGASEVYMLCVIEKGTAESVKREHRIPAREYASLLQQRDPKRCDVVKENLCFMWRNHYCEIGKFVSPERYVDQAIMYIDCGSDDQLPPWIAVDRDVTNDIQFSSYNLALRDGGPVSPTPNGD